MFDKVIDRTNTFCTQWDYVQDRFGVKDLLPFTISDTDFAIPNSVQQVLMTRLKHGVFGYTRWNHAEFKNTVVNWYKNRFHTKIESEWIAYAPTVIYSVSSLIQLKSKTGDGVVVFTPVYDAFLKVIRENNREIIEEKLIYQNGKYSINFSTLEKTLAVPKNKIFLLCSPHNPTGRVWTKEELNKIIELTEKYKVFIISDDIHMDILRSGQTFRPLIKYTRNNLAIVTSGSKTFNFPGLIFSYLIIPDEQLREMFLKKLKETDGLSSASTLGLLATMQAYKEEAWVDELNQYVEKTEEFVRDYLAEYHPDIYLVKAEATYLLWLDITQLNIPMKELQKAMVQVGKIAIMDGEIYRGAGFLRLNIGCPRSKVIEGLKRLTISINFIRGI